ncbi:hypothetical protein EJD97_009152, partial [Solanum chilense]
ATGSSQRYKTSNITLHGSKNERLGDFRLARHMDHKKSPASILIAGTKMGYIAPEYLQYRKANKKTTVFNYCVFILKAAGESRPI